MFGRKRNLPEQGQPSQRFAQEEAVERFRQCLRAVDGLIKQGDLERARLQLEEAAKLEPNNPYLKAFDERIRFLEKNPDTLRSVSPRPAQHTDPAGSPEITQTISGSMAEEALRRKTEAEYRQKFTSELRNAESTAIRTLEEFETNRAKSLHAVKQEFERAYQTQISEERKRMKEEAEAVIEAERQKLQEQYENIIVQHNEAVKAIRDELRNNFEQTLYRRLEQISREYDDKLEMLGATMPATHEARLALYRERMAEFYIHGLPTVVDAQRLMRLKELLEITFDEHFDIEGAVKVEAFCDRLREKTLRGDITVKDKKKLQQLRERYGITPGQQSAISGFIESNLKRGKSRGSLLIVDDDESLVKLLKTHFEEESFEVAYALNVDAALAILRHSAVDLILCDIKFPEGELDGFKLFSSVQEIPHLKKVPFIFMSVLTDGLVMRSGFELGIDDYITKPLDLDLLASIIEGKLKRFAALHRR